MKRAYVSLALLWVLTAALAAQSNFRIVGDSELIVPATVRYCVDNYEGTLALRFTWARENRSDDFENPAALRMARDGCAEYRYDDRQFVGTYFFTALKAEGGEWIEINPPVILNLFSSPPSAISSGFYDLEGRPLQHGQVIARGERVGETCFYRGVVDVAGVVPLGNRNLVRFDTDEDCVTRVGLDGGGESDVGEQDLNPPPCEMDLVCEDTAATPDLNPTYSPTMPGLRGRVSGTHYLVGPIFGR